MDIKSSKRVGLLDGYVTEHELATELNKDPRTLFRWRKLRIGPPFVMNGVVPIYNVEQARKWLAAGGTTGKASDRAPPSKRTGTRRK
jgi:hypothetical protein